MEGEGVAIRIAGNEEPPERSIIEGRQHLAAALDDQIVKRIRIVAGDPQDHAGSQRAGFRQWAKRFAQRQGDRLGGKDDGAGRVSLLGRKAEDFPVKLGGCGEVADLQGDEGWSDWHCHDGCSGLLSGSLYLYQVPDMSMRKMTPSSGEGWIGYSLKIAQHRLRQRLEAELSGSGVSAAQNAVLLAISNNPRISNASLARAAFVTPQSMQGMLVTLERDGFIVRTPHPEHGRIIMTELSEKGRTAAQAGMLAAETAERTMLADLTEDEAKLLGELLQRCAQALEPDS